MCLREGDNWEVLVVGGRIILKMESPGNNLVFGLTWLRIETDGCLRSTQKFGVP